MEATKQKIKQFEIGKYRAQYEFHKLPFGAKQDETYSNSFEINYTSPKHSTERNSLAWNIWMNRRKLRNGN